MANGIIKSGIVLIALSMCGKFIGFFREVLVASYFGASIETDCFFLANGLIANILYGLSTALAVAFLPIYMQKKGSAPSHEVQRFAFTILSFFFLAAVIVSVAIIAAAPWLARLAAPAYESYYHNVISFYLRMLSAGLIFSLVVSLLRSLLEAERIYGYTALTGIVSSMTMIVFVIMFHQRLGVFSLVLSVPTAYVIDVVILGYRSFPFLAFSKPILTDPAIKKMLFLALPILLSNTTLEINQFVNRMLISRFADGAVSAFSYSGTLSLFVTGTMIASVITIFYTEFSHLYAKNAKDNSCGAQVMDFMMSILLLVTPIACVTFFYARDIVTIAFARGAFGSSAVRLTSLGLQCYACGFVFIVLKALFIKAFFAMRDSRTPMVISICEVACNIIIAVSLSYLIGFAGVIISISVSSFFASLVMLLILHRRIPGLRLVNIYQSLLKLLVALFLLGLFLRVSTEYQVHNSVYIRFALVVAASGIIYIGSLTVLRCREFIRLLLSARRVIRRKFC